MGLSSRRCLRFRERGICSRGSFETWRNKAGEKPIMSEVDRRTHLFDAGQLRRIISQATNDKPRVQHSLEDFLKEEKYQRRRSEIFSAVHSEDRPRSREGDVPPSCDG